MLKAKIKGKWEIKNTKKEYDKSIAMDSKNNPKAFSKYANSQLKTKSTIPNFKKTDGTKTGSEKAEELHKLFSSMFTKEHMNSLLLFEDPINGLALQDMKEMKLYLWTNYKI